MRIRHRLRRRGSPRSRSVAARRRRPFRAGPPELAVVRTALVIDHDAGRGLVSASSRSNTRCCSVGSALARRAPAVPATRRHLDHFRRSALDTIGGWDPQRHRDADIAVRIITRRMARRRRRLRRTREETPIDLRAWLAPADPLDEGWMQAWLAHMRSPLRHHRELEASPERSPSTSSSPVGSRRHLHNAEPPVALAAGQRLHYRSSSGETIDWRDVVALSSVRLHLGPPRRAFILAMRGVRALARRSRLADVLSMPLYWCAGDLYRRDPN